MAIQDLGRRLVMNLRNDRLSTGQLERYGSLGLCDVKGIVGRLGHPPDGVITIIVNGSNVMEGLPVHALCAWQAGEVELVEFGDNVCRDVTRTGAMVVTLRSEGPKGPISRWRPAPSLRSG